MTIPTYLPYYVLIGAIAIIATILFGLRNALAQAASPKHDRAKRFVSSRSYSSAGFWSPPRWD
jgi:hypothetical protein